MGTVSNSIDGGVDDSEIYVVGQKFKSLGQGHHQTQKPTREPVGHSVPPLGAKHGMRDGADPCRRGAWRQFGLKAEVSLNDATPNGCFLGKVTTKHSVRV